MRRLRLVVGLLFAASGIVSAQTGGQITGEVKDQSGAVVPKRGGHGYQYRDQCGANHVTNTSGLYSFPGPDSRAYTSKGRHAGGFQTAVTNRISSSRCSRPRASISRLAVGQATQTVEVAANAALLTTENATVGTVIEEQRITRTAAERPQLLQPGRAEPQRDLRIHRRRAGRRPAWAARAAV